MRRHIWVPEQFEEEVHQTVQKAPQLVANNREMIAAAQQVIRGYQQEVHLPNASLTKRQIFYQLIEVIGLPNTGSAYDKTCDVLTAACLQGVIPWAHIVDRSRSVEHVSMWPSLERFAHDASRSYRGDVWAMQDQRTLFWVEKDARAAWVKQIVEPYGMPVVPGRGASSWGLIREAAQLMGDGYGWSVPYLGDFDPSGLMISEHIRIALAALGCRPEWRVLAVRHEDMPDIPRAAWQDPKVSHWDEKQGRMVKGDPNTPAFLERYGRNQKCAEVDSMPPALLRARILAAANDRMDMAAWRRRMRLDSVEKEAVLDTLLPLADDPGRRRELERDARHATLAYYNREDVAEATENRAADYVGLADLDQDDSDDSDDYSSDNTTAADALRAADITGDDPRDEEITDIAWYRDNFSMATLVHAWHDADARYMDAPIDSRQEDHWKRVWDALDEMVIARAEASEPELVRACTAAYAAWSAYHGDDEEGERLRIRYSQAQEALDAALMDRYS